LSADESKKILEERVLAYKEEIRFDEISGQIWITDYNVSDTE
jgi:hypothetical protein